MTEDQQLIAMESRLADTLTRLGEAREENKRLQRDMQAMHAKIEWLTEQNQRWMSRCYAAENGYEQIA